MGVYLTYNNSILVYNTFSHNRSEQLTLHNIKKKITLKLQKHKLLATLVLPWTQVHGTITLAVFN